MCCFTYNSVFALSGPPTVQNQNISRSSLGVSWQLDSNTISLRQEARIDQEMSRCRWRQRWEWCAWSPDWSTWQTSSSASHRFWKQTFHYHSLFFSLTQRRKFLDDRGYWAVLSWFFHTEKGWNKQKCTDSKRLPALNNQSEKGTATVGTFPADKNLRIGEWPARKLKGSSQIFCSVSVADSPKYYLGPHFTASVHNDDIRCFLLGQY